MSRTLSITPADRRVETPLVISEYEDDPAAVVEFFDSGVVDELPPLPIPWRRPIAFVQWSVGRLFGLLTLVLLIAVVAAVPLLNFAAFGYLLAAEGRVARSGRLRFAAPALGLATRLGTIALGLTIFLLPLSLISGAAADAALVDPGSDVAVRWQRAKVILSVIVAVHLLLALARGGALSCFFRPLKNVLWLWRRGRDGSYWNFADTAISDYVRNWQLPRLASLGLRGFVGSLLWLAVPTLGLAAATTEDPGLLFVAAIGGVLMLPVLAWLPFLQARFAAENRWSALWEWREVRELGCRAPLAFLFATIATYALALPLYLSKIVLAPRDAMWLVTLVFVVTIWPARLFVGWAYARAQKKSGPAWFGFRWGSRVVLVAALAFYVLMLFFTPFISEHGRRVLFEHHALLLPSPF